MTQNESQNNYIPEKKNLTRRSFLKILGTSLLSHFVFLNLSKKSWAQSSGTGGPSMDYECDEPSVKDQCGKPKSSGGIEPDSCGSSLDRGGDPDHCAEASAGGGMIPDTCGTNYYDDDKCGEVGSGGQIVPDGCSSVHDQDCCGQSDALGNAIPDSCEMKGPLNSNPDKCGGKDFAGNIIPDKCSELNSDPDKCGQKDANGGTIPDLCKPPDDPDWCVPPKTEPEDVCEPNKGETHVICTGLWAGSVKPKDVEHKDI